MTIDRPNTLAGLVEKRAEIAGQIAHTRATLRQLIIDLDHVDAAIRIFDPSYDVEGIRQKIPTAAHRALRGDYDPRDARCPAGRAGADDDQGARPACDGRARVEHGRCCALTAFHPAHRRIAAASEETWHSPVGQRPEARPVRPVGDRGLIGVFLILRPFAKICGVSFLDHLTLNSAGDSVLYKTANHSRPSFAISARFGRDRPSTRRSPGEA